jgi:hypothetical protein
MNDIEGLFADHQPHNSDFQVERFAIAANGGTPFGCYQQSLRDLRTSYDALTGYYFELEKLRLDLEEQEQHPAYDDENGRSIETRRAHLEARRLRARIAAIEHHAADQGRVFGKLLALARAFKRMIGELTPERRAECEADTWEHHAKVAIAVDLASGVPALPRATLEMIAALPVDMRARVNQKWNTAEAQTALVEWWRNYAPTIPDVEPVPIDEVRSLVCRSRSHPLTLA